MKNKLAIVTSGGGMSCSYSVGAVLALAQEYGITKPDLAIGSSGSAGTLAYYVAGQYDSIRNIWENLLCTNKFINPLRLSKIIDIDYLIDEVFKIQDPLQSDKVYNSPIKLILSCTNYETGDIKFFDNRCGDDIFEILRATKAMPLVYGSTVKIGLGRFCDTYASSNINLEIKKAINEGATKIIVIDNMYRNPISRIGFSFWLRLRNRLFRANLRRKLAECERAKFSKKVKIFFIKPSKKLPTDTLNNNRHDLKATIELGYQDTAENVELKKLLLLS